MLQQEKQQHETLLFFMQKTITTKYIVLDNSVKFLVDVPWSCTSVTWFVKCYDSLADKIV